MSTMDHYLTHQGVSGDDHLARGKHWNSSMCVDHGDGSDGML